MRTIGERRTNQAAAIKLALAACACAATLAASTLLAGCDSASASVDRADYSTTLNRYYEGRPMCLWTESVTFPVAAITPDQASQRGFDALVDAGLLDRKRTGKSAAQALYTYDLTKEGYSALDRDIDHPGTGNFCYGRRRLVGIDSDRQNSPTTERIDFRYAIAQPASWATEVSVQHAFPQVVAELAGPHKAQATLLNTDQGWEVSGAPATLAQPAAALPSPTLAKARALLHLNNKQAS
ncbi:MAG TPA: hypothetical protein VGU23_08190 [Acidobacteriaceae bacterium]|nr:hypothetical protein [Acidobacteriaceae bacterium]